MADKNSVITRYRRENLCRITSGSISAISPVTHIAFGSGGVDGSGVPIPPEIDASALNREVARYPIDAPPTYPVSPATTAQYVCTIPAADLAGTIISEAALVDGEGKLCAIKTFGARRKDEGIEFMFTFSDEFLD